jgi:hypothetical protein
VAQSAHLSRTIDLAERAGALQRPWQEGTFSLFTAVRPEASGSFPSESSFRMSESQRFYFNLQTPDLPTPGSPIKERGRLAREPMRCESPES